MRTRLRVWAPDLLAIAWLLGAGVAMLIPALARGISLGPFDALAQWGVSQRPNVVVHNTQVADQIDAIIPWTTLAWEQVHQGHLPLWNDLVGPGMPLAFNWQTAAFSAPALFGYLFPVHLAYTVQVVVTILISGVGVYVLCRILGLGRVASVFAGTTFELSGPMVGWLGWPHSGVISWAGWLFAAAVLILRGRRRARDVAFFAVVVALATYAGQPEMLFLLGLALGVFLAVWLVLEMRARGIRSIARPILDLSIATVAGFALAAPLAIPSLELVGEAVRNNFAGDVALPIRVVLRVFFQGYDGLPIAGNNWFGYGLYAGTAIYVGVIAVVCAGVGIALRRRQRAVVAFALVAAAMGTMVFVPPVVSVLNELPVVGGVFWHRALLPMALAVAVLGGFAIDLFVRRTVRRDIRVWLAVGFSATAVGLLFLFLTDRGGIPSNLSSIRSRSFVWPTVQVAGGLAVVGATTLLLRRRRRRPTADRRSPLRLGRRAGFALLVLQTAFLVSAGAPIFSSSPDFFRPTAAERALKQAVGSSMVAAGEGNCFTGPHIGFIPNVNIPHKVRQFAIYDPMTPLTYFESWRNTTGTPAGIRRWYFWCPRVTTAAQARLYGIEYVLVSRGAPGPRGGTFDRRIGDADLYRISDVAEATLVGVQSSDALPPAEAPGDPVRVRHPSPSTWKMSIATNGPTVLRLRLGNVPGWHATIDGRPLDLLPFEGMMLQARIPPGHHTVEVSYWPRSFSLGIVLAACSGFGLMVALFVSGARRRRARVEVGAP